MRISTGYVPRAPFIPFHERTQRFASMVVHRRGGKTVCAIMDAVDLTLRCKLQMARGGFIAPFYRQAKEIAWGYLKHYTQHIPGVKLNETELRVDLPGNRVFRLYGADNPDSLRGVYFDALVLDEPADMDPRLWGEVVRPALADRKGRCTIIGTLKGRDWFLENHRKAERDPENWYTLTLRASESGILSPDELDAMRRDMTPAQIAQELECNPEDSGATQFVPTYLVMQARDRKVQLEAYRHAPRVLGVDVARHGDDSTCIVRRQGVMVWKPQLYRIPDLTKIAEEVITHILDWDPDAIFVDATGIGWGVIDYLRKVGYGKIVHAVQTGEKAGNDARYYNKRVELWGRVKEWLPEGSLPDDEVLVNDLTTPTVGYDLKNRFVLEKKEDIKARGLPSPDTGDALALTFYQTIAPRDPVNDEPEFLKRVAGLRRGNKPRHHLLG